MQERSPNSVAPETRSRWLEWSAVLVFGIALGGALWYFDSDDPVGPVEGESVEIPKDPRVTYSGPYLNVSPSVKYVGSEACDLCHLEESEEFHHHPMGRSIATVADAVAKPLYSNPTPFRFGNSEFVLVRDGKKLWNKQTVLGSDGKPLAEFRSELQYVFGSGRRGHAYFSTRGKGLFKSAISRFSQKSTWDISPGYRSGKMRPITSECVYCHANDSAPIEGSLNLYEQPIVRGPAIGCERCHGPGQAHVDKWLGDAPIERGKDYTIVNPIDLELHLRESICQQCHLEATVRVPRRGRSEYDFRPGLPFESVFHAFVPTEPKKGQDWFVSQVEQMYESKCFKASGGKLGCISCHDAHMAITDSNRVDYYRGRCLECHKTKSPCTTSLEVRIRTNGDSCYECHMPRGKAVELVHSAATDHRVPRLPGQYASGPRTPGTSRVPLKSFHASKHQKDPWLERDLGLALAKLSEKNADYAKHRSLAIQLMKRTLERDPDDTPVALRSASASNILDEVKQARPLLERVLKHDPNNVKALSEMATGYESEQRFDLAEQYWEHCVKANPTVAEFHHYLALVRARQRKWQAALEATRRGLSVDEAHGSARVVLAFCLERLGKKDEAEREWRIVEALRTPRMERLRSMLESLR